MSATGDFSDLFDYDDDTIAAAAAAAVTSPFHQSLDLSKDQSLSGFNPQALHNPTTASSTLGARDIAAAESPDSLNDSFRDSSSDSGSSKRTGSSASGKIALTAGDIIMTDGNDIKKEWNSASFSKGSDDGTFIFGSNMPSSVMGDNFDLPTDDNFMNDSFDFESASSSPEAANNAATNLASPDMPTMTAHIPHNSQTPSKSKSQAPRKKSQFPLTQPMHGLHMSASREVSPLSQNVASQQASPSNFFNNSPSPTNQPDFSNHVAAAVGHPFWPQVDGGHAMPPGFPMMQQFHPQLMQQMLFAQGGFNPMPYHCKLIIHPTPTKSRVETQIPIKMTLLGAPPGVKRLHLPTHTISKPKLLAKSPSERSPDMLELYTQLVCTSAMLVGDNKQRAFKRAAAASHPHPSLNERSASEDSNEEDKPQNGGEVRICQGCITRERKRAGRKKIKKVEEEEMWKKDENRRVIVFNTNEIKEWQPPSATPADPAVAGPPEPQYPAGALQVDAPMRIACYCRHHAEKMGFRVVFTIKDWQDRVVAQEMSHSIMITDDHKTHPVPQTLNAIGSQGEENSVVPMVNAPLETSPLSTPAPFRVSQSSSDLQSLRRNGSTQLPGPPPLPAPPPVVKHQTPPASAPSVPALSRPASPSLSNMGPASKKRKAGGPRVPMEMAMTRLDTSPPPGTQPSASQAPATAPASTSPFTPNLGLNLQMPDNMFAQTGAVQNVPPPFATGPTTPNNISDQNMFGNAARSASMDNLAMTMFSAPTSAHPSRAPSPNSLRQSLGGVPQTPMAHGLINGMTFLPGSQSQSRPQPTIHKIIPGEGPKMGGIEVTILGGGFFQGLDVYFGEHKATTTTFWGESSLVCLLPPASRPGIVPVSLKQSQAQSPPFKPNPNQVFRYTDDEEAQLARMMIGMISQKMTGQLLDVRELAQRIMGPQDMDWSSMGGGSSSGGGFGGGNTYSTSTESQLLKCLELIDLDDSARMPRLDLRRNTGQAMLHFGCSLGYHRFVAGLLARGANPDLRDKGGFTPMHMAAINDHEAIVRRLMQAGADPTIRSLSGLRPADVARSRKVIEHIRRCERHVRSRSGGSLHSRASSAASLRSLWDPHAVSEESDDPGDGEESPEYSSGDFESEDEAEDNWLNMRRSSTHAYGAPTERDSLSEERDELQRVPGSPTTALAAAVRDQVSAQLHQFQQAMAMHFPNMSQMPNLPQMPNFPRMSMLPDYQQYLHQHPLMGRMTSFMEGMSGSRPGSAGDETPKAMDGKWWDFSSLLNNNNNTASPPAYTELYPQDALDKKQASAAGAAAEAEADAKCAKLFDTATAEAIEETSEAATSEAPVPKALMIGRKKAMTKEQQQDFLRAHAAKFKGIRSDKNLWFIWIPLLTVLLASMLYIRFPEHFATAWSMIRSVPAQQVPEAARNLRDRVVEVL
ncbi:hypothetical protein VDGD_06761 [Verticillium dahliae]|nr:hypothetical protein VDGD_06761 [Verticillium dahliae]